MDAGRGDLSPALRALAARSDRHRFILDRLAPQRVAGLPGISLFQAHPASRLNRRADAGRAPPYWAYAWGGGLALARYILDHGLDAQNLLDCGTGSGLVGILAAQSGAQVTVNDIDPYALAAAECNAVLNGVALAIEPGDLLDRDPPETDGILAGDLFYDEALAGRALHFLRRCRDVGKSVLIGDPGRRHLPREALHCLAVYDVVDMGGSPVQAGVYRLE